LVYFLTSLIINNIITVKILPSAKPDFKNHLLIGYEALPNNLPIKVADEKKKSEIEVLGKYFVSCSLVQDLLSERSSFI
jgi:hypothetical protein